MGSLVIDVLGLIVACMTTWSGKLLSQNTKLYTICVIRLGGYLLKGRESVVDLAPFLTVPMFTLFKDKMFMLPSRWYHTVAKPFRSPLLVTDVVPAF